MPKKLSPDAKLAITQKVIEETRHELDYRFKELEKNIIESVSSNINKYLLKNSEQIVESSRKIYKKKIRNSVACILENYKDLKDFLESVENTDDNSQVNRKFNQVIRTNECIYEPGKW